MLSISIEAYFGQTKFEIEDTAGVNPWRFIKFKEAYKVGIFAALKKENFLEPCL
jgi:hypothetical protein